MTKVLLIDNYDSFTYNLAQYLWQLGCEVEVRRNDAVSSREVAEIAPTHLVISPGPGTPHDAGASLDILRDWHQHLPIMGVCLGHQCLGHLFGGVVERAPAPRHGKTSTVEHTASGVFAGLVSPFLATRYHSLVLREDSIDPAQLRITAHSTDDKQVMGIEHTSLPLYGVQFHPESIASEHGLALLSNFLGLDRPEMGVEEQ